LHAARFYAKTFSDSSVGAVHRAPGDFPSGKLGVTIAPKANVFFAGFIMSFLHRYEPRESRVNDALAVELWSP
jgi:predicted 3-demethylubiquinone-9 3-methyltransferase (glyoxalase superfamily)